MQREVIINATKKKFFAEFEAAIKNGEYLVISVNTSMVSVHNGAFYLFS